MTEKLEENEEENVLFKEEKFSDEAEDDSEAIEIPPKDRKLVTHPYDFIVRSLDQQIKDDTLILADKYQRRRVWNLTQYSRLIESLLINVPIPICYFAEVESGQYTVIDGQQRLSAIHRFLNNEYYLRGLQVRHELNKKHFRQLPVEDQRLILSRSLRCIVILKESHPDIRFDVFERLNTASTKLSTQELRNCIYRGDLNDLCKELSENRDFIFVRNAKGPDLRMQDIEMVLRFFAFYDNLPNYKGSLKRFLDKYLENGLKLEAGKVEELKALFFRVIDDVKYVFGNNAFRRYDKDGKLWENSLNRSVYDAVMLSFANSESEEIRRHKEEILRGFMELCNENVEFKDAITAWTKDKVKVKARIVLFRQMMVELGIPVKEIKFWNGE
jgi:uncharacterized protein with ParB-like and HNH nuclease domain